MPSVELERVLSRLIFWIVVVDCGSDEGRKKQSHPPSGFFDITQKNLRKSGIGGKFTQRFYKEWQTKKGSVCEARGEVDTASTPSARRPSPPRACRPSEKQIRALIRALFEELRTPLEFIGSSPASQPSCAPRGSAHASCAAPAPAAFLPCPVECLCGRQFPFE